ncbi:hypothetical protein AWB78_07963 [Caballeronia calidae]|uniref:TPR repeat-containing protein n=1 Tax=Caballeronia calidae TaxID=1777139 RepID=A0A158EHD4_9BURK|nr:hypothetical protein AWB78_07963 [Caballeronia calidae]
MIKFSLVKFEYLCYRREIEKAAALLIELLRTLDRRYGVMLDLDVWSQSIEARDILDEHLLTRLASAITVWASDPTFLISEEGAKTLMHYQRWLSAIFAASSFRNADHILRSFSVDENSRTEINLRNREFRKFQLFYFPESEVTLNWDVFWKCNKEMAASLAVSLLSARFLGTPCAHSKREMLLRWLPERLAEIESLDALPFGVLHDMYMHCSYADFVGKHDIKKPINELIRRKLASLDLHDIVRGERSPKKIEKPVLIVVLEWFSENHSIYRTHSRTMYAMRDKFHLVGMGFEDRVDEPGRSVFHEFVGLSEMDVWGVVRQIKNESEAREAQVMYMPSVGMFAHTMILTCLRVAPLQLMALGHPATTHAHAIDYVVVEEDYVGDEACFSEKLLKLPADGMPYRASAALRELRLPKKKPSKGLVKIAVAGTAMKQNPGFFRMCALISRESKVPVQFHFLVGQASGIIFPQVRNLARRMVGDNAIVHRHQNYKDYMNILAQCDLFLNPFPFGNTNGIVDTVWAGLVGICKTGREVHEHIDEGMFRRLNFPSWMIAKTNEEYKVAALRLIENKDERKSLSVKLAGPKAVEKLIFRGRPEILGERIAELWWKQGEVGYS